VSWTERTIGHGIKVGSYEYIGLVSSVLGQKGQLDMGIKYVTMST